MLVVVAEKKSIFLSKKSLLAIGVKIWHDLKSDPNLTWKISSLGQLVWHMSRVRDGNLTRLEIRVRSGFDPKNR